MAEYSVVLTNEEIDMLRSGLTELIAGWIPPGGPLWATPSRKQSDERIDFAKALKDKLLKAPKVETTSL